LYELFIGLRYLRGRAFLSAITIISVLSVAFGVLVLVFVLSIMTGFESYLTGKILGGHAHLVLEKDEFAGWQEALGKVSQDTRVVAAAPFLSHEGMISSRFQVLGVVIKGIDPKRSPKVTDLERNVYMYLEEPWDLRVAGGIDLLEDPAKLEKLTREHFGVIHLLPDEKGELSPPSKMGKSHTERPKKMLFESAVPKPPLTPAPPPKAVAKPAPPPDNDDFPEEHALPAQKPYPGIMLGRELARQLKVSLGSVVHLIAPMGGAGPAGVSPKTRAFRVAAIVYAEMYEFDTKFAYITLPEAQSFFDVGDTVTGLEVKLQDHFQAREIGEALAAKVGGDLKAKDWSVMNRSLFSALSLEKVAMFIILSLIIVVAAFNIVSTLVMMVFEKGKEIAILKSMGATDAGVMRIFLFEGLVVGGIGTILGLAAGVAVSLGLGAYGVPLKAEVYYITTLPVEVRVWEILAVAAASMGISFLATLYPSLTAARLRPVEALRYE
jgi:lipoprotein-releasing system permease protein